MTVNELIEILKDLSNDEILVNGNSIDDVLDMIDENGICFYNIVG